MFIENFSKPVLTAKKRSSVPKKNTFCVFFIPFKIGQKQQILV